MLRGTATDATGATTAYLYDDLGRVVATTGPDGVSTLSTYDVDGNVVASLRQGADGSQMTLGGNEYGTSGRLVRSTDALGHATTYAEAYDPATGVRTSTTTYPDGTTAVSVADADGRSN